VDSYHNDFYCVSVSGHCTDAHPVFGGVNRTNFVTETAIKYVNNFIEGAGENMLHCGGIGNTTPSNFEIRGNLFFKPQTWNQDDTSYNGGIGGNPYIVKNLFKIKKHATGFARGEPVHQ
jgi:hypothetical protein